MKKILFILATLALSTNLFSQIKLVKGSSTFLTENKTALVVFDYSNSQWENDEPLLENFEWGGKGSVPEKIELACNSFLRYFNENSRGLKIESCKAVDKDRVLYSKSIDDEQIDLDE